MFEISWGEIFVVGAVGVALTGRRDLPAACRYVGSQLGRVVGLLQGARVRADQFAHKNELKQLQNEFRSGLRELDQVKMELAMAASTQGMIGRNLGVTTASANRIASTNQVGSRSSLNMGATATTTANFSDTQTRAAYPASATRSLAIPLNDVGPEVSPSTIGEESMKPQRSDMDMFEFQVVAENDVGIDNSKALASSYSSEPLKRISHTERAVMEEEWMKQGIGFRSIAEQGQWNVSSNQSWDTSKATGSELLEHLERQCLIFDQYDHAVAKEDRSLRERIMKKTEDRLYKDGPGPDNNSFSERG